MKFVSLLPLTCAFLSCKFLSILVGCLGGLLLVVFAKFSKDQVCLGWVLPEQGGMRMQANIIKFSKCQLCPSRVFLEQSDLCE